MSSLVVVKFGGSVLSDELGVAKAAEWIKKLIDQGRRVVVVVSALRGVTDELLRSAQRLNPEASPEMMDEVLAMGERTSARLFALALARHGVESVVVDPGSGLWPVVTDDKHLDANPLLQECRVRVEAGLRRLLQEGKVPVVCGYVGVAKNSGKITTMGRGGSDTTATLLANCLDADEVILVKDVSGVYSADPKSSSGASVIQVISSNELMQLAVSGAKVIHSKALRYLSGRTRIRIGSLESLMEDKGTLIIPSEKPDIEVEITKDNLTIATVLGEDLESPDGLGLIVDALRKARAKLVFLSIGEGFLTLCFGGNGEFVEELHNNLVTNGLGKAVSHFPNLSMITISGKMLDTSPGVIHKVTQPLAAQAINIYGAVTIGSTVRIFVSHKEAEKAKQLINEELRGMVDEAA